MKLATYKDDTLDGRLHIVSEDMKTAMPSAVCKTLQSALDNWRAVESRLQSEYRTLNSGQGTRVVDFNSTHCHAPLPRAYQWLDGSAYVNHVALVRQARGVQLPDSFWQDPLMYQGCSSYMLGAHDDIVFGDPSWGVDMEAEIVVFTDNVPMGTAPEHAQQYIRLVGIVNDVSFRGLIPAELQ